MLTVNGELVKGMKEAAEYFKVSEKTLRNWLSSGKIARPPETRQGTRVLRYFPDDYLEQAKHDLGI